MFLKALHVVGFKSFADKTQIQFHPGVTAVVGPNGCGKSNVLDSIRWVLGEQSAKALRGGQMQDIIFSGSDARRPLGLAEVSLTFGDCETRLGTDFNEVTITRRLFRDGASEYEINRSPCRLRDIHQLFMDTGIGRTAYSIMEQGKIDQILSARPEDRRAVFEEAAGITRFKSQKKEALRKLEHTETNLLRLDDIVREVRRQIGSLQRQAGKARRYQELFEQLRTIEIRLAKHQYDVLISEIQQLQAQADATRQTHEQLTLNLEQEDASLRGLRAHLAALEGEIHELREQLNAVRMQASRAEQRERTNQARVQEFGDLRENCRLEISATGEKIRIQEEQLQSVETQLREHAQVRAAAETACREQENAVRELARQLTEKEKARTDKNHAITRAQSQLSNLRNQQTALEMQQKNTLLRIESLRTEQASLSQRREEAEQKRLGQATELQEAERQLTRARTRRQELSQAVEASVLAARETERRQREATAQLQKLQARVEALLQLESSHADSPPATQHILQAAGRGEISAEVAGTLSDHLQIMPGYEAAITLLLGEAINAILIENEEGVRHILQKLRDRTEGQFILAPRLLPRANPAPHSSETCALRFVEASPVAQPLIVSLLAEAHVVADLSAAWSIKYAQPHSSIVTQDGVMLTRFGLIHSGKTAGVSLAVFTRRNERKDLEAHIVTLQARATEAAQAATQAAEILQQQQTAIGLAQAEAQQAEIRFATLRHTQRTLQESVTEFDATAQRTTQEINRLLTQEEGDRQRQQKCAEEMRTRDTEVETAQREWALLQEELATFQQQETGLRQKLVEQQIQLATRNQQQKSWQEQLLTVQARLQELRELHATRSREAGDYEKRIGQAEQEIQQAQAERTQTSVAAEKIEEELQTRLTAKLEQQTLIETRERGLREERKKLTEIQSVQSECEIRLAERRLTLSHLTERLQQAYQIQVDEIQSTEAENPATPADWRAMEAQVREMRERVEGMGPVNLESIAEYEELEERLKFLESQQADLLKGREQLLQAIQEINQTTQKMFAETFEQVKKNFQEIFTELFGGGKASLVLVDDKDPLECGIDIVARPPGKQPQSITLLSGGEKTMTAVALLFAIYMVKPSPFCVLDEMDAPLDESNINRFIRLVQRFTEHSQFVIITHNKRTISMADALYGVTMEERGVSRVMSVKLARDTAAELPGLKKNVHVRGVEPMAEEKPAEASAAWEVN